MIGMNITGHARDTNFTASSPSVTLHIRMMSGTGKCVIATGNEHETGDFQGTIIINYGLKEIHWSEINYQPAL